jgi:hypothetical protein
MRYFTRGWAAGDLSDEEDQAVRDAYDARLAKIAERLPPAMLRLAREVSLHDGLIESIFWSPKKKLLKLDLVCGDLQRGYSLVELSYGEALLGGQRLAALKRAALSRETELLYDEVDIGEDGLLCHRILFWPNEEVTLDFSQFEMSISPRPDRRVELLGTFYEEPLDAED